MTISERIKELREEYNWTQKDLANHAQLSPQCISLIEKGEREPGISTALAIADAFSVSLDFLIGNDEKRQSFHKEFSFSKQEQDLVIYYRNLSDGMKHHFFEMIKNIAGDSSTDSKKYS